jgi:hypothetical protein
MTTVLGKPREFDRKRLALTDRPEPADRPVPVSGAASSAPGDSGENEPPDVGGSGRPEPERDVLELRSAGEHVVDEAGWWPP